MKVIQFIAVATLVLGSCHVQKNLSKTKPGVPVKVTDWARTIMLFPDHYWDKKEDTLVHQIGKLEFEKMKIYSHRDHIPCQMQLFCEDKNGSPKKDLDTLRNRMNKLNAYLIARYSHTNNKGKVSQWVILRVPYSENKSWDSAARWDTVYFAVRKEVVEVID